MSRHKSQKNQNQETAISDLLKQIKTLSKDIYNGNHKSQLTLGNTYKKIAEIYFRQSNYDDARTYYAKALTVFNSIKDYKGYLACQNARASICLAKGDLAAAKSELKSLLNQLKQKPHKDYEHIVLNNLGIAYEKTGDLARAVLYFFRSLALKKEFHNSVSPTYTLHNLAGVYLQVEDYQTSINYNQLALESLNDENDLIAKASIYNGIAQSLSKSNKHAKAQEYFTKAKKLAQSAHSLTHLAESLTGLGHLAFIKGDFELAKHLLEQSLETSNKIKEQENIVLCLIDLAKIYQKKDIEKSMELARKAIMICQINGYRALLARVYKLAGKLKATANDYVKAYYYSQLFIELFGETNKTSILNQVEVNRLSLALESSQLQSKQFQETVEKLEHESSHDHLTGAGNRRHLDRILSENWVPKLHDDFPIFLAMLDIDDFKKVNDGFSHELGDQVLKQTALIIRDQLATEDLLFRYGGEEFVILLKEKTHKQAVLTFQNIRSSIQNYDWKAYHPQLLITATLGVVNNSENQRIKSALKTADARMYVGKNSGKNTVIFQ